MNEENYGPYGKNTESNDTQKHGDHLEILPRRIDEESFKNFQQETLVKLDQALAEIKKTGHVVPVIDWYQGCLNQWQLLCLKQEKSLYPVINLHFDAYKLFDRPRIIEKFRNAGFMSPSQWQELREKHVIRIDEFGPKEMHIPDEQMPVSKQIAQEIMCLIETKCTSSFYVSDFDTVIKTYKNAVLKGISHEDQMRKDHKKDILKDLDQALAETKKTGHVVPVIDWFNQSIEKTYQLFNQSIWLEESVIAVAFDPQGVSKKLRDAGFKEPYEWEYLTEPEYEWVNGQRQKKDPPAELKKMTPLEIANQQIIYYMEHACHGACLPDISDDIELYKQFVQSLPSQVQKGHLPQLKPTDKPRLHD